VLEVSSGDYTPMTALFAHHAKVVEPMHRGFHLHLHVHVRFKSRKLTLLSCYVAWQNVQFLTNTREVKRRMPQHPA
jgi:hypothetical protein